MDSKSKCVLGFLTVVEHPQLGLCGGYLLLNHCGRPLEFHCTAPLKPNRAQEILYGPTLLPFLYGEQIGRALLAKADEKPHWLCVDQEPALAVREFADMPVVLVLPVEPSADEPTSAAATPTTSGGDGIILRCDAAHVRLKGFSVFALGRNQVAVPAGAESDRQQVAQAAALLGDAFDLSEPFGRIRQAIEEAQRAVR